MWDHYILVVRSVTCCGNATHYLSRISWRHWGCQRWLLVSETMWISAAVNMNRPYSAEPDCQKCIREGLCSSDGDTEDRDMLERLRYWILLPDSWVTFQLSRGTRQRWISQSSALLSAAPPTGLRINAPFYLSAEQGDSSWTASPSIRVQCGDTQKKKKQPCSHKWFFTCKLEQLKENLKKSTACLVYVHCNSCWEELGTKLNVAASGQFKKEARRTHTANCTLPSPTDAPSPSSHLRRTAIHKYMQHDCARSHANALNTNETRLDSKTARQLSTSLVPQGRIYNLASPFCGCKVKVTNHGFIWRPQ